MIPLQGFEEIEHTADWALRVWAPSPSELFRQAAIGMNSLCEVKLDQSTRIEEKLELSAIDLESLLVSFLSELVYYGEEEATAFDRFSIEINGVRLKAEMVGAPVVSRKKEIKAVTYHNLEIVETDSGFEVVIVFDV